MGNIGESIQDVFRSVFSLFLNFVSLWFWPIILIGLMILSIIVMIIVVRRSYENRILKAVNSLNKYFLSKPYINNDNLIEFNGKMKNVPKVLRSNWQAFMLNREDAPTDYINVSTCVEQPLKSSSIEKHISNFTHFSIFLMLISFVCGIPYATSVLSSSNVGEILFYSLIVPAIIALLYTIFIVIFRANKNDIYSVLYENFPLLERNLTKAVTTLPSYVDYEILFTKKEISEGIPILQQYLEKRAANEQKELEKARENAQKGEEYDFSDLGIDGSLVLERAMKESETFLKAKRRIQDESNSIEAEKENYKKTFENNSKDLQRKLQASRENLDSLKKQQEESTNRIETNYLRKQLADEMKKQLQLEKDLEEATVKFNEEQVALQKEIDERAVEIEEKKKFVEKAMLLEFKHYANMLFKALTQKAADVSNEKLIALSEQNNDLRTLINDLEGEGEELGYDNNQNLVHPNELATGSIYDIEGENEQYKEVKEKLEPQAEQPILSEPQQLESQNSLPDDLNNVVGNQVPDQEPSNEPVRRESLLAPQDEQILEPVVTKKSAPSNKNSAKSNTKSSTKAQTKKPAKSKKPVGTKKKVHDEEDELSKLQKQIEKENAHIKEQKSKLNEELKNTISKIDEKPKKTRKSNATTLPKAPKARAKSRRIVKKDDVKKTSPKTNRKVTSKKSGNELDSLNAEMQNLLKKAKKK